MKMEFHEDRRMRICRRSLVISWLFFTLYVTAVMAFTYFSGTKPLVFGLPGWLAIGNIFVPTLFVFALIFVVEKFIPDLPLTDAGQDTEEEP
jgi:uncharacterized membrane protein YhdT